MEADLVDHEHVARRIGRPGQHVAYVDDVRRVAGDPPRPDRLGSRRDDHHVGPLLVDEGGIHVHAALHFDAEAMALAQLVAHEVTEFRSVGYRRGQTHLPAGGRFLLVHGDAVSSGAGTDRGLQSGGTRAHD